jgi:hypothetical protein
MTDMLMGMFFIFIACATARADYSQIICTELTAYDSLAFSADNPDHYLNARQFAGHHILATFELDTLDSPPVNVETVWHEKWMGLTATSSLTSLPILAAPSGPELNAP